jgi:peptidoglycan hydrolase-like protein with peptidoglycan-binding domain
VLPTITPSVTGSWSQPRPDELRFSPSAPFVPYTKYTVTVPGGQEGVTSTHGAHLRSTTTASFTIAPGSTKRLQELLAVLGYLPLSYTGPSPAPQDMAMPQPGTLAWRWSGLPSALTGQWTPGIPNALTKGAVMMFETENGLTVDGIPGPVVWTALLHDVASDKANTEPVTYVLVTKNLAPVEHLTAWVNGTLEFHDILVNTGVRGATTHNGTYQVFEHVRTSHMSGTDVTGTHYTIPTVPWVSYFNGGDALHYYPRAAYGFPQSNGCVEMQLATAQALWPNTPIGTLVTVQGPTYGGTSSKNTTPTS